MHRLFSRLSDFYPRPPRGGRHVGRTQVLVHIQFLSTPSARRATIRKEIKLCWINYFYPRPPRGGRRPTLHAVAGCCRYFYPRPPRGGRLAYPKEYELVIRFLSTPSARRATGEFQILLHFCNDFYPRPPRGGRRCCRPPALGLLPISIHALREEGDMSPCAIRCDTAISIHALREEGDVTIQQSASDCI